MRIPPWKNLSDIEMIEIDATNLTEAKALAEGRT
jgi:hypothetical protein